MHFKVFNTPKFSLISWIELGAGLVVSGSLIVSHYPF